ncbi:dihydroneopterin aldolase [Flavobacterium crassostreae]|uniref:7,8-dihydroneopterin aldolase n=1 Tax=Flavobacterium crassostreae TaxID=1763534 RepID=A0A1B9E611_9FLAO|nr:dihydroneopterin aldolase [Flavobacterium crassostreae]OCB77404.1 dihydroneopterin aldolase [Flavobacterium crassostreae]
MGTIKLKNIRTFSYHGCLIEEGKIGSDYVINLEVKTDFKKSCTSDDLKDTVDYVLLNKIVKEEMAIRSHLLEHVGQRITTRILDSVPEISRVLLGISKLNPPIGGDVEAVTIELKEYRSKTDSKK